MGLLITVTLNYLKSTNYEGLYKRATTTATLFATTTKDAVLSHDLASLEDFTTELMKTRIWCMSESNHMTDRFFLRPETKQF